MLKWKWLLSVALELQSIFTDSPSRVPLSIHTKERETDLLCCKLGGWDTKGESDTKVTDCWPAKGPRLHSRLFQLQSSNCIFTFLVFIHLTILSSTFSGMRRPGESPQLKMWRSVPPNSHTAGSSQSFGGGGKHRNNVRTRQNTCPAQKPQVMQVKDPKKVPLLWMDGAVPPHTQVCFPSSSSELDLQRSPKWRFWTTEALKECLWNPDSWVPPQTFPNKNLSEPRNFFFFFNGKLCVSPLHRALPVFSVSLKFQDMYCWTKLENLYF